MIDKEKKFLSLKKALEKNIEKTNECWNWIGFIDSDGYGRVSSKYTKEFHAQTQHRAAWIVYKGEIPKGKIVRHTCNNRRCANPDHLKLGTLKENSRDMIKAKRQAFGSKNGNAKLDENDVRFIKKMLKKGKSCPLIAELFDVHFDAISRISRGLTWSHVTIEDNS